MSNWRTIWRRLSIVSGIGALAVAFWGGIHLGHLLDEGGGRHAGEVLGIAVVALVLLVAGGYQ